MTKKMKELFGKFKGLDMDAQERVIRRIEKDGHENFADALRHMKRAEKGVRDMKRYIDQI